MADTPYKSAQAFVAAANAAGDRLLSQQGLLDDRIDKLRDLLDVFEGDVDSAMRAFDSPDDDLKALASPVVHAITAGVVDWAEECDRLIAGEEFVSRFDESLIVFALGKVKAGKSSLGNAIAGLDFSSSPSNPYRGVRVELRVHERADTSRTCTSSACFMCRHNSQAVSVFCCIAPVIWLY